MTIINYNEEELKNARDKVDECNVSIIESLNSIYHEVIDIDTVLNTPKSQEILVNYNNYLKDKIEYLNEKRYDYKYKFYYIIDQYEKYYNEIKKITGGNHD